MKNIPSSFCAAVLFKPKQPLEIIEVLIPELLPGQILVKIFYAGLCHSQLQANTNYNPSTPYAVSRAATDMWLMNLHTNYKFPVVFTPAANVYGPGQQLYRIIPKTIISIKNRKKLPLHGGGYSIRSFIHIQDVVDGTLKALLNGQVGQIYHFSTVRNIAICDVVKLICVKLKINYEDVVDITEDRSGKDAAYLLDSQQSYKTLGWKDTIDLEEGIEQTIEWVQRNLNVLKAQPGDYIHKP